MGGEGESPPEDEGEPGEEGYPEWGANHGDDEPPWPRTGEGTNGAAPYEWPHDEPFFERKLA